MVTTLSISVNGQGLLAFTRQVQQAVSATDIKEGLCTLFIQHTSASLLIQENYDPSAQADLENWLNRLVPEHDPLYTHTLEGPDDISHDNGSFLLITARNCLKAEYAL